MSQDKHITLNKVSRYRLDKVMSTKQQTAQFGYEVERGSSMLRYLSQSGINVKLPGHNSYKLTTKNNVFMPLTVETFYAGHDANGNEILKVSVCHYGEQNGDLMRDPEIVYRVIEMSGTLMEMPEMVQMDYSGHYQEAIYEDDNGKTLIRPAVVKDLQSFTKLWVKNLREQKHQLTKVDIDADIKNPKPLTISADERKELLTHLIERGFTAENATEYLSFLYPEAGQ